MTDRTETTAPGPRDGARTPAPSSKIPGRRKAFEEEAVPHLEAVRRFALRLAGSEAEADDLTQETFLRAFQAWHQYKAGTRCRSWLFTICRNTYLKARRRHRRLQELLLQECSGAPPAGSPRDPFRRQGVQPDPETRFFHEFVDPRILDAIHRLPPSCRRAVELCDVEELTYGEAADALDVPLGTVKSRLSRGRKRLREELGECRVDPAGPAAGARAGGAAVRVA